MTNITAEVLINNDRRLTLDLELPPDCPTGPATVTLNLAPKAMSPEQAKNKMNELRGKYRGKIWMAADFDAPLEDFAEYM
jgi:hypothetical protein